MFNAIGFKKIKQIENNSVFEIKSIERRIELLIVPAKYRTEDCFYEAFLHFFISDQLVYSMLVTECSDLKALTKRLEYLHPFCVSFLSHAASKFNS